MLILGFDDVAGPFLLSLTEAAAVTSRGPGALGASATGPCVIPMCTFVLSSKNDDVECLCS